MAPRRSHINAAALPEHQRELTEFLQAKIAKNQTSMLELTQKMGYAGRSAIQMVVSGERTFPMDRVNDMAKALHLDGEEREELRLLCAVAAADPVIHATIAKLRGRGRQAPAISDPERAELERLRTIAQLAKTSTDQTLREVVARLG